MYGLALQIPGSPSDLNTGNGTEGAMVCTSLGRRLRPLFYFLCSNLKANPVQCISTAHLLEIIVLLTVMLFFLCCVMENTRPDYFHRKKHCGDSNC